MAINTAKFSIGDVVRHKHFDFRGVIYDVDFEFNNSEEWYQSIPKNVRPMKRSASPPPMLTKPNPFRFWLK